MASARHASCGRATKTKWERTRRILALVPPKGASSDSSTTSEDEVIIQNLTERRRQVSESSSEPRSIPSSLENLNIYDSSDDDPSKGILSDEDTVPLTPVIRQMFSTDNSPQLPNLHSVSSVLSPIASIETRTRTKRQIHKQPTLRTKKAKKYVREPLQYKWQTGKFQYSANFEEPQLSSVPLHSKTPVDYFYNFFSMDIIKHITDHTNLYSVQSQTGKCINISEDDIRDFLAITIMMGLVQMSAYRDYWSNDFRYAQVADIMSLKKYEQIRKYLHFVDNMELNDDRYFKVRPLLEKIRQNCLQLEEEGRYSIDEMMVPYKGTRAGSRRQYMPKKPKKWGFKMFVRAGVSGLVYDFLPYAGDDTFRYNTFTEYENSLGLGAKVVIALCKSIKNKPSVVYFDNFFTSLELIHLLRDTYGIFSIGTIRSNRLRGCGEKLPTDKQLSKKGRGSSKQIVCNKNKIAVVKWFDNKSVTLASSFVDSFPIEKIKRFSKEKKCKVDIDCPQAVRQYNMHMGGVDLADMLIALYRTQFKTKRWYMAIFSQAIDICVNNAWLLYRRDHKADSKKCLSLKKFRYQIYIELLHKNRTRIVLKENNPPLQIKTPVAPRPPDGIRFDNTGHLPVFVSYGRCKYCKNGYTNMNCVKCNIRLCLVSKRNCFYNYHTNE